MGALRDRLLERRVGLRALAGGVVRHALGGVGLAQAGLQRQRPLAIGRDGLERHALHFHQQPLAIAAGERRVGMGEIRIGLDRLDEHLARDLERTLAPAAADQERAAHQIILVRFRAGGRRRLAGAERGDAFRRRRIRACRQQAGEPQPRGQMLEIRRYLVGFLAQHVGGGESRRLRRDIGRQRLRRVDPARQRLRRRAIRPHPDRRRGVARESGKRILVAPRVEIGRTQQIPGTSWDRRTDRPSSPARTSRFPPPAGRTRSRPSPSPPARRASWG